MKQRVGAVILAAGKGTRMGQTKQLLPIGHKPMLQHTIDHVLQAGFSSVYVVLGHDEAAIRQAISNEDGKIHWLVNQKYREGQSTSLKLAFTKLKNSYTHFMMFLGDVPCIHTRTTRYLLNESIAKAVEHHNPFIVRPTFQGKNGHPVFVGNVDHEIFMEIKGDSGLRSIINQLPNVYTKEVQDEGIMLDVDTVEQYETMRNYMQTIQSK